MQASMLVLSGDFSEPFYLVVGLDQLQQSSMFRMIGLHKQEQHCICPLDSNRGCALPTFPPMATILRGKIKGTLPLRWLAAMVIVAAILIF